MLKFFHDGREIAKFPADRPHWDADSDDLEFFPLQPIPFLDGLDFEVRELDDFGDDIGLGRIDALPSRDAGDDPNWPATERETLVRVGSGAYELRYNLARNPVGGSPHGAP